MDRIPIVIDTDPGVDDFFCLALGCVFDDVLDLRAVCSMGGNHRTDVTTQNALNILDFFGKNKIPVARGVDSYLTAEFGEPVVRCHGENGLGNIEIPTCSREPDALQAWDKLYQEAKNADGGLVLVTVAPLTNIAVALQKYSDLPRYIKKIVMMGGSTKNGNITPYAEANIGHDAEAAALVFESGIPIDMVGLNVTSVCPINIDIFKNYEGKVHPEILSAMRELIRFRNGEAMHDIIAIATLVDDQLMTWKPGNVKVELENVERKGQTIFTENPEANCRVAVDVDVSRYDTVIDGLLRRLSL